MDITAPPARYAINKVSCVSDYETGSVAYALMSLPRRTLHIYAREPQAGKLLAFNEVSVDLYTKPRPFRNSDVTIAVHNRVIVHYGEAVPVITDRRVV